MTSPNDDSPERVDLRKDGAGEDAPLDFDPYRFGRPEHPVPPEYAPPGYSAPGPPPPPAAYSPYGPSSPYGSTPPPGYPGAPQGSWPPPPAGPYGQYPNPYGAAKPNHNHGKAVTALVLGIASIVFCWLTLFDALLVVPALVFSLIVINDRRSTGRGMAIAGLVCAIVGAVAAVALLIWLAPIAQDCSGLSGDSYQSCIRDHL